MLSDEECREIWQTSMARCHPMNDISVAGIRTAKAAFALGAERERAKYKALHKAADAVVNYARWKGSIEARGDRMQALMDALYAIDGHNYQPEQQEPV